MTTTAKEDFEQKANCKDAAYLHLVDRRICDESRWSECKNYDSNKRLYENLSNFQEKLVLVEQISEKLGLITKAANCYEEAINKAVISN